MESIRNGKHLPSLKSSLFQAYLPYSAKSHMLMHLPQCLEGKTCVHISNEKEEVYSKGS
jgi:hypothetical protein